MSAVVILVIFAVFAALMYARRLPAILAVPLMAVAMALAAGVGLGRIGTIVTGGAVALAPVYVAVVFGALLGRVTLDTGIARAIVNLAAEYGGERPFALALAMCAVVALLFVSLQGLGAIIMVGSIVLPIMMTTGVPRTIAATLFLMAFALGFIFNIANWTFYTKFFGVTPEHLVRYAIVLAIVDAVALVVYAAVAFRRERGYATWAVRATGDDGETRGVPAVAMLAPVLPIVLYYALHLEAAPAFLLSAIFAVLVTRPRDAVQTLIAAAVRGVEDVAPAVLLFMGIGMLLVATQQPQFAAALAPLAHGGWVRNPIAYVAVFGLASPLVLYRGPLNPFGVGIAIFTVLLASNAVPPVILVAASWRSSKCRTSATRPIRPTFGWRTSPACRSTQSPSGRCRFKPRWRPWRPSPSRSRRRHSSGCTRLPQRCRKRAPTSRRRPQRPDSTRPPRRADASP